MECPNFQMFDNTMSRQRAIYRQTGLRSPSMTTGAEEMQDMDSLSFKGHMGRVEAVWDS